MSHRRAQRLRIWRGIVLTFSMVTVIAACGGGDEEEVDGNAAAQGQRESAAARTKRNFSGTTERFVDALADGDAATMRELWSEMTDDERRESVNASLAEVVGTAQSDPDAYERMQPAIEFLNSLDTEELYAGFYDDDGDDEIDEDPLGGRTLAEDYPAPPYGNDDAIVDDFVDAFKRSDLDGMVDIWARMHARERQRARQQASDYRFSVPPEDDERYEAVQAPYELLMTADAALIDSDARAEANGESRWQDRQQTGPTLPDEVGHVRGIVVDRDTGEPLEGVTVQASFPEGLLLQLTGTGPSWAAVTAADGSFEIRDIPAGDAALTAHKLPYYNLFQHEVTVVADETADQRIALPAIKRRTLELPTFLTGIVTDSATGQPVEGVLVSIGNSAYTSTTREDGRYLIRKVPAGEHPVLARHRDYHEASGNIVASDPGKLELDFAIDAITTGTVTGIAVDSRSGQPLANARVTIAGQTVTTDAEGRFRLSEIESGDITVAAGSDGYRQASSAVTLDARSTAETVLELEPITEGAVRGVVVNAQTGEPVADATIRIARFETVSDVEGRFAVSDVTEGDANITAQKRIFEAASMTVEVIAMQTVDVRLELEPITYGDIVISVTDASSGTPIASSAVRLGGEFSGETDADGRIRFERVPAGNGLATAERHAYLAGETTYTLEPATELAVGVALDPVTVGSVAGRVISSADGAAIADASVTIGQRSVRTNASGDYRIDELAAGDVNVIAGKAVFESGSTTALVVAADTVEVNIELEPITYGTINGVIVDALTSEPVADASVSVTGRTTKTNGNGEFALERVSAGDVMLSASKRVYETVQDSFELSPAETIERRIALPPITYGDVTGRVIDADTRAPLANADVVVGTVRVKTDADGRFGPQRADAGPLTVSARKTHYESGGAGIDVAAADTTDALIELEPIRIGTVTGTVVDAKTGEPVDGARVTLGSAAVETTGDGRFRFDEVKTGAVGVAVRHADYGDGAASGDLEGGETLDLLVRVDLRREDVTQLESALASGGSIDLYGIHFDSGKDQFKPSSLGTLNAVLEVMKRAPERNFEIAGHTDSDGSDASNQDLSERRARTVINWLVQRGIEARRLSAGGYGESRPTAPNDTEAGKALNRRVELRYGS